MRFRAVSLRTAYRAFLPISGYGVDPFGFDPQYLKRYLGLGAWVYRKYFRCESFGVQNLPDGPALVIANHSGQLPYDGAMISMATFLDREPPRFLRSMVERFVPSMPFVSPFLARCVVRFWGRRKTAVDCSKLVSPSWCSRKGYAASIRPGRIAISFSALVKALCAWRSKRRSL